MIPEIIQDIGSFLANNPGSLAIVEGTRASDGSTAYVLCFVKEEEDGVSMLPVGELRADAGEAYIPHPDAAVRVCGAPEPEPDADKDLKTFELDVGED
jgi:hypothetical protein